MGCSIGATLYDSGDPLCQRPSPISLLHHDAALDLEPLLRVNGGAMANSDGYQQGFLSVKVFTHLILLVILKFKSNRDMSNMPGMLLY